MAAIRHRPHVRALALHLVAGSVLLLTGCAGDDDAAGGPNATAGATATTDSRSMTSTQEATMGAEPMESEGEMGSMAADAPRLPPVFGYHDGEQVLFVHPEASDPDIAQTLEGMMGSPVPVVLSLADVPESARSPLYVFTNGVTPEDTPAGPAGLPTRRVRHRAG
ncbi:hypothetical protein [Euzebya sp.]|uniref:hypothetical protein n=1 Tax=Euzebya sp. TaxID=1971409 RepID=UPI0035182692